MRARKLVRCAALRARPSLPLSERAWFRRRLVLLRERNREIGGARSRITEANELAGAAALPDDDLLPDARRLGGHHVLQPVVEDDRLVAKVDLLRRPAARRLRRLALQPDRRGVV